MNTLFDVFSPLKPHVHELLVVSTSVSVHKPVCGFYTSRSTRMAFSNFHLSPLTAVVVLESKALLSLALTSEVCVAPEARVTCSVEPTSDDAEAGVGGWGCRALISVGGRCLKRSHTLCLRTWQSVVTLFWKRPRRSLGNKVVVNLYLSREEVPFRERRVFTITPELHITTTAPVHTHTQQLGVQVVFQSSNRLLTQRRD